MEPMKDQLERVVASGQLKPIERMQPTLSGKQKLKRANTWQVLLSRRLVTEPVGSDQYLVFELDTADLTDQQLDMGIKKSRDLSAFKNGWYSTPGFRELCKVLPADLGLPDAKVAMHEFCDAPYPKAQQTYSHEAVYLAGDAVGLRNMENLTEVELFPLYEQAYEVLVKRALAGEDLKRPVPKALPAQVFVPCTQDEAKAGILKLRQAFMPTLDWGDMFEDGKHAGNTVKYVYDHDASFLRTAIKNGNYLVTDDVRNKLFAKVKSNG